MYAQKKRVPVGGVRGGRQKIQWKSGAWERVERLLPRDHGEGEDEVIYGRR